MNLGRVSSSSLPLNESAEAGLASSKTGLAASTALAEQLQDDLAAAETALGDAQAEIEDLRLRYGDQIRADLQESYGDQVASACDQAGQNPTRSVDSFVSYDTDWDHLEFDEDQLNADVTECASPAREASQLTRQDAVAALEPVAALVMEAIRSDDQPDDLEDQIRSIAMASRTRRCTKIAVLTGGKRWNGSRPATTAPTVDAP